jgi:hypothetical protein
MRLPVFMSRPSLEPLCPRKGAISPVTWHALNCEADARLYVVREPPAKSQRTPGVTGTYLVLVDLVKRRIMRRLLPTK